MEKDTVAPSLPPSFPPSLHPSLPTLVNTLEQAHKEARHNNVAQAKDRKGVLPGSRGRLKEEEEEGREGSGGREGGEGGEVSHSYKDLSPRPRMEKGYCWGPWPPGGGRGREGGRKGCTLTNNTLVPRREEREV